MKNYFSCLFPTKLLLLLFGMFCFCSETIWSQTPNSNVYLTWNRQVSCQISELNEFRIGILDFEDAPCLRVCDESLVTYTLVNLTPATVVTWTVGGGVVQNVLNNTATIQWNNQQNGYISFQFTIDSNIITKTLCIEKVKNPSAVFTVNNDSQIDIMQIESCLQQTIHFVNNSSTNGGSQIMNYYWDFGDGGISYEQSPSYQYSSSGQYPVTLQVTNSCGCSSIMEGYVFVSERTSFEISCATVLCENGIGEYSIPDEIANFCDGNWIVDGGTAIHSIPGKVQIQWDDVSDTGFGFVTFVPTNCNVECFEPTTIKVPIIQTSGTIQGESEICSGKQQAYSLPQWPSTEIIWSIENISNGTLEVDVVPTYQRNEVIVNVLTGSGTFNLVAHYQNTLLGCAGTAEIEISVKPQLEILEVTTICTGTNYVFEHNEQVSVNWQLFFNNNLVSSQTGVSFNYNFTQAGNYEIKASNLNYCATSRSFSVINKPNIPAGITGDTEVCPQLAYIYNVVNPQNDLIYIWTVSNGAFVGSDQGDQVQVVFSGTFPASVSVRAKNPLIEDCLSDVLTLNIQALPLAAVISEGSNFVCSSSVTNYSAFFVGTTTLHDEADTYTWSLSNPLIGSISSGQGTAEVEVTWNSVNVTFPVDLILTMTRCSLPSVVVQQAISVQFIPEIMFQEIINISPCGNETVTVTVIPSDGNVVMNNSNTQILWITDEVNFVGGLTENFTFVNNTGDDITRTISAQIFSYNGCEGTSNLLNVSITVLPTPPAVVTYSSENNFCDESEIDTFLNVSTNLTNVSYQWFRNSTILPAETNSTLQTTPQSGFGSYYCVVTNTVSGCSGTSNNVNIFQRNCTTTEDCQLAVTPAIDNTSQLSSCGTITLSGGSNGYNENWSFTGPEGAVSNLTNNTISGPPGIYAITLTATYDCTNTSQVHYESETIEVIIPYEPSLIYDVQCSSVPNIFDIAFYLQNSSFYPLLTNPEETVSYSIDGGNNWIQVTQSYFAVQAGSLILRVTNNGILNGVPQITCWRDYEVNLVTINNNFIEFDPPQNQLCFDSAVRFGFGNNINPDNFSFLWTFGTGPNAITNTLFNPSVVFTTPGIHNVSVEVSNVLGCSRTFNTTITIPNSCFGGTIVSSPTNATVCEGESVTLTYVPTVSNCDIFQYRWMHGQQLIPNTLNSPSITVGQPGYYWLELVSLNECKYVVPNRIYPRFRNLPPAKIIGESNFCIGDMVVLNGLFTGNSSWSINNTVVASNVDFISTSSLGLGDHTVTLTVTDNSGCVSTATHSIHISDIPSNVQITPELMSCHPYVVKLTATATNASHFVWSNGTVGNITYVYHGSLVGVKAKNGSCEAATQLLIPSHPQEYMWSYPSGCIDLCEGDQGYVLGPLATIDFQDWNFNEDQIDFVQNSNSPEFSIADTGSYSATIQHAGCEVETPVLNTTRHFCKECGGRPEIGEITTVFSNDLCAFNVPITFGNTSIDPLQITLSNDLDNFVIVPATIQVPANGFITVQLTIYPVNGFVPNSAYQITVFGVYTTPEFMPSYCSSSFDIILEDCIADRVAPNPFKEKFSSSIDYYPNPVLNSLKVTWTDSNSIDAINIYDLSGRKVLETTVEKETLKKELHIEALPSGVYIMMVKNNTTIIGQYKIIKQ